MKRSTLRAQAVSFPYLLWMTVFTVIPLGLVIWFALTSDDGRFTLDNITEMTQYMPVLFRSISLAIISTLICLIIGIPTAYIISRAMPNKQGTLITLMMLPMWINFLLRTYAWITILDTNGILNKFFGLFGLGPFNMLNNQGAIVLGMVYNYLPFMILPLYSVMTKIDSSIVEAAQDLGARPLVTAFKVIIPLSLQGIYTGITTVFVPSVSTFIISRLLGGGTNDLIGDLIEQQFLGNSYNPHLGSAMALLLMVLVLFIMSLLNQFGNEEDMII